MLLVFSDDWGRHPSSCQHLVRHLLPRHRVAWVNTIGMRAPALNLATAQRGWEKLRQWSIPRATVRALSNPQVLSPRMWPWFRRPHDRWLNQRLLRQALEPLLASASEPVHAITTVPIVADLVGTLNVERWIYYSVDDFSVWPGLDHAAIAKMERKLLDECDEVVAVSETLVEHAAQSGRKAHLLSHGVDLTFWQNPSTSPLTERLADFERPLVVFWGVIDQRLNAAWIEELAKNMSRGTILLVGPLDNPVPQLLRTPRVKHLPAVDFRLLPELGQAANVLVMPYDDLPVTRAMQPLKLKEYLATGKPVVVSSLPAVNSWRDCLDCASSATEFSELVKARIDGDMPAGQRLARQRLQFEGWQEKSMQFESWVMDSRTDGLQSRTTEMLSARLQAGAC